jgi:hypothetical protein
MFITDDDETTHNMALVRQFYRKGDKVALEYQDRIIVLMTKNYDRLLNELRPTIAANPGFEWLEFDWYYLKDKDPDTYGIKGRVIRCRNPVIAWRVEDNFEPIPVTLDDKSSKSPTLRTAILCPNGRVIRPGSQCWDSLDNWIEYVRQEWKDAIKAGERTKVTSGS